MEYAQIDLLSVFIAAVLYMMINFFWYSKWLFGKTWMKCSGVTEREMKQNRGAFFWGFLIALVLAYFIAFFEAALKVTTAIDGVFVGFCLWLGFVATTQFSSYVWCRKPLKLFLINTGAKLLSILAMSGVIGA